MNRLDVAYGLSVEHVWCKRKLNILCKIQTFKDKVLCHAIIILSRQIKRLRSLSMHPIVPCGGFMDLRVLFLTAGKTELKSHPYLRLPPPPPPAIDNDKYVPVYSES